MQEARQTSKKKHFSRWFAFVWVPIVIFAVIEIFLRAAGIGSVQIHRELSNGLSVRTPHSTYLNISENRNQVFYNNFGFHDVDRQNKGAGLRFTVIGDSFVEGAQVPRDSTFTQMAEGDLRTAGFDAEIVNAGTSGSNTGYQYVLWRDYLNPQLDTDVLILCLYLGDDLAQNHPRLLRDFLKRTPGNRHFFISESGETILVSRQRSSVIYGLRFHTRYSRLLFAIYQFASEKRSESSQKSAASKKPAAVEDLEPAWNEALRGTLALIDRWQREAAGDGIRFGVMTIPSWYGAEHRNYGHPARDRFVEKLRVWADARSVPLLETDLSMKGPLDYYSFDKSRPGHFNFEGHAETGRQLAIWIKENFITAEAIGV